MNPSNIFTAHQRRCTSTTSPRSQIFAHLTEADWRAILDAGELLNFENDEVILLEGVENASMYFIDEGEVSIARNDKGTRIELAKLGTGAIFGEMSVLDGAKVSASVVALGEVDVIRIGRDELDQLMERDPELGLRFYRSLAETLSGRLRDTNHRVRNLQ